MIATITVFLRCLEDTQRLGEAVARVCGGGVTICLSGELGSGKTTLARSVIGALGSSLPVSSPTFVLSHEYPVKNALTVEHWDLYRLGGAPEDLWDPPLPTTVRIIEWAEREPALLGSSDLHVTLVAPEASSPERTVTIAGRLMVELDAAYRALSSGSCA